MPSDVFKPKRFPKKEFLALKKAFPQSKIHVRANQYIKDLCSFIPQIDHIIEIKSGWMETVKILWQVAHNKYDVAIDLNFDYGLWPAFITGMAGSFSIGYDYAGRGFLLSKKVPMPDSQKHTTDIYSELIKPFTIPAKLMKSSIIVSEKVISDTQQLLDGYGITEKDTLILMHPGAHHATQQWLPEYFAEIGDHIIKSNRAKLALLAGPSEKHLLKNIRALMKEAPSCSLVDCNTKILIGLVKRADLMICNNSGPLHIAVAINTQTISIMGPTLKNRWMPKGSIHKVFRMDDLPCIGCNMGYCKIKTHDCMRLITPSLVFKHVKDYL